ncbi:MAG: endonuclease V [Thermomicrobiales bacterium]
MRVTVNPAYLPDTAEAPREAIARQRVWAALVREEPLRRPPETIAAVDVHLGADRAIAVAALVAFPDLTPIAVVSADAPLAYPYVPGLLSWRELPAAVAALEQLPAAPDVLIADGQGLAHPRRFGLACHLGLAVDLPTLGCAKSILVGRFEGLGETAASIAPLVDKGEVIGTALRTRTNVAPVFVSIGQRITLDEAVEIVRRSAVRTKLPEPSRLAHKEAQRLARASRS